MSYDHESAKRSTPAGIARAALAGDAESLKALASMAVVLLETAEVHAPTELREVAEVLAGVFAQVAGDSNLLAAFGQTRAHAGRPPSFATLRKQWLLRNAMTGHIASLRGKTPEQAADHLLACGYQDAAAVIRQCVGPGKLRLSAEDASTVAAAVVARRHSVSPDTARAAVKGRK